MKSLRQRVLLGFFAVFGLRLLAVPISIVLSVILARRLGPTDYGLITLSLGVCSLFSILADPGIDQSITKHIAEYRHKDPSVLKKTIKQVLLIRSLLSLSVALICLILAKELSSVYNTPDLEKMLQITAAYLFTKSTLSLSQGLIMGFENIKRMAIIDFLSEALKLPICVFLVYEGFGATGAYLGYLISTLIALLVSLYFLLRKYRGLQPGPSIIRKLLKYALPLWLTSAAVIIYSNLDRAMIGLFRSTSEVAFYSVAAALVSSFSLLPSALNSIYFPIVSNVFASGDSKSLEQLFTKTTKYLLVLFVPAVAGIFYISLPLVNDLYTSDYIQSAILIKIMAINLVPSALMAILSVYFAAAGKAIRLTVYVLVMAGINAILNLLLIPKFGALGASVATVVAQFALLFLAMKDQRKYFNYSIRKGIPLFRIFISTGSMVVVLYLFFPSPHGVLSLILAICVGMLAYFGILFLSRGLTFKELKLFRP